MSKINRKYLNILSRKKLQKPIKIPRYMSEKILAERSKWRSICVYLELKPLFYTGHFKDAKANLPTIARYLGMSANSLRSKLKCLASMGLVYWEGRDFWLCSWDDFYQAFGQARTHRRKYSFYRLRNHFQNSEALLKYYTLYENFERQKMAINTKLARGENNDQYQYQLLEQIQAVYKRDIALEDKQRIVAKLRRGFDDNLGVIKGKGYRKKVLIEQRQREYIKPFYKSLATFNVQLRVNLDVTVSCRRFASLFGLASPSTGHYWQRRLSGDFMHIHARSIYVKDCDTLRFNTTKSNGELKNHYFQGSSRGVFRRMTNLIVLRPLA